MKLFAPKYVRDFNCIADKCRHSCCVGWEIDIDKDTLYKYRASTHPYAERIRSSISGIDAHFTLCENDRCPHLNKNGLCEIILNIGEDHLCEICREHPRFYNRVAQGMEQGIGLSCEEASRIILSSDSYDEIEEIGITDGDTEQGYDYTVQRSVVYSLLSDRKIPYRERLENIYASFSVTPEIREDSEWVDILNSLEYLDETHRELFACYSSRIEECEKYERELERALAYFIYRHCAKAESDGEFQEYLGFALFCERLLASLARANDCEITELARILSEELEYSEQNTEDIVFEFCN